MRESPEKSQIAVFREMVEEMLSIQSQLAENDQEDITLRDRIIMSCDFPDVRSALKPRTPSDSQDVMNMIELFLKSSAGSAGEKVLLADESEGSGEGVEGFYGFNRRFGGVP
jgi:hypothetical protein